MAEGEVIDDIDGRIQLEKLKFPKINYVQKSTLAAPPLNLFAIALSLSMLAFAMMGWIDYESPTLGTLIGIGGLALYICGFYDWYQRNTMASFIDFVFAFLHLTIYFTAYLGKLGIYVPHQYYSYMQGTFYCIFLVGAIFIILGIKDKGPVHLLAFLVITIGIILVIIWEYSYRSWAKTIAGYFIFIGSIFLWICGLGKLLQKVFLLPSFPGISPIL